MAIWEKNYNHVDISMMQHHLPHELFYKKYTAARSRLWLNAQTLDLNFKTKPWFWWAHALKQITNKLQCSRWVLIQHNVCQTLPVVQFYLCISAKWNFFSLDILNLMHSIQCPLIAQRIRRTDINSNNWRLSVLFPGKALSGVTWFPSWNWIHENSKDVCTRYCCWNFLIRRAHAT